MTNKIIKEIAGGILDYLKKNNLEKLLPEIIDYLNKRRVENVAYVYVPRRISNKEKMTVINLVKRLSGINPEKVVFNEDRQIIDGLKIFFKDRMWDFTLSGKLNDLKGV